MPQKQKAINDSTTIEQKKILNLESFYFNKIWDICNSEPFIKDLREIEEYIKTNYVKLSEKWRVKNKIKIPAERLVRFHIYTQLSNEIKNIYPSAISGDMAFIVEDAIINIDVKTIDLKGNKNDLRYLQFENNQSSFENQHLYSDIKCSYKGVPVLAQLPSIDNYNNKNYPVLTYFLSINYYDDGKSEFKLNCDDTYGTIVLKCLPNGKLSNLFNNDIVSNFKTYTYYDKKSLYGPKLICEKESKDKFSQNVKQHTKDTWKSMDISCKEGFYCAETDVAWVRVDRKDKIYLEAIKSGNTARVENYILQDRYDGSNKHWLGYMKKTL